MSAQTAPRSCARRRRRFNVQGDHRGVTLHSTSIVPSTESPARPRCVSCLCLSESCVAGSTTPDLRPIHQRPRPPLFVVFAVDLHAILSRGASPGHSQECVRADLRPTRLPADFPVTSATLNAWRGFRSRPLRSCRASHRAIPREMLSHFIRVLSLAFALSRCVWTRLHRSRVAVVLLRASALSRRV